MGKQNKEFFRVNNQIRSKTVRLVGENIVPGLYDIEIALKLADSLDEDLVEVSPNINPPICKVIDYQKFLYERKKKQKDNEKNQVQQKLKEVRLTPVIGEHDYKFKLKQIIEFLEDKNKVKIGVFFQGRMITHVDIGKILIERIINDVSHIGKPEAQPRLEGKRMLLTLQPK
jgi:translation initiation factor IF-3